MQTAESEKKEASEADLPDGPWLDHLDPSFLARTYPGWAANVSTIEDAALAFRCHGFAELAALAKGLDFDPNYYAETNPAWQGTHDLERYRNWLLEGIATGRPGSPAAHLRKLGLPLDCYPAAFPWEYYARLRPSAGAHKWAALDDFCESGFATLIDGMRFEPRAFEFLVAVGRMYSTRDDSLAIRAFELARSLGSLPFREEQHLADAYLRQGLWRPAFDLYRGIIQAAEETPWTLRNLAKCAARLEQWTALRAAVETVGRRLSDRLPWYDAASEVIGTIFEGHASLARTMMAAGQYPGADNLLGRSLADLARLLTDFIPSLPPRDHDSIGKVLVLSNEDDADSAYRRVREKLTLLDQLALSHRVIAFEAAEQLIAELPEATAVILFRVPALPPVLRCIVAARQLGIPIYYDSDRLLLDTENTPAIPAYRGLLTGSVYDDVRFGFSLARAAARLSDFGIAPTGRLAETLRPLVQSGICFIVKDTFPDSAETDHTPLARAEPRKPKLFLRVATLTFLDVETGTIGERLLSVLQQWPNVELYVSGALHLDIRFDLLGGRIHHIGQSGSLRDYRRYLAVSDINLLVRCDTPDDEYQAEISWAEAADVAVPSVMFMPAGVLPDLQDAENVLRAADASGWGVAISRLIEDRDLRQRVAGRANLDAATSRASSNAARALEHALAEGRRLVRTP